MWSKVNEGKQVLQSDHIERLAQFLALVLKQFGQINADENACVASAECS